VGRSGIQIVIQFLDVFSVISLMACHSKESFFENGILAVPERERKTEALMIVGDPGDAIFAPPICARASLLVREMTPGIAISRIILANGGLKYVYERIDLVGRGTRRTHCLSLK